MRYLIRGAETTHTELFGVLQSVSEEAGGQTLKVIDKRGKLHVVAAADIQAARVL